MTYFAAIGPPDFSELNLDKRTASLLSSLTDRKSLAVRGLNIARYSKSTAIYAGENPGTQRIPNSEFTSTSLLQTRRYLTLHNGWNK